MKFPICRYELNTKASSFGDPGVAILALLRRSVGVAYTQVNRDSQHRPDHRGRHGLWRLWVHGASADPHAEA